MGFTRDRHPPTLGLHHEVVAGARARRAEAGDGAPDEPRVPREHRGSAEPPTLERAWTEVLHHHIRLSDQTLDQRPVLRAIQVRRDAEFVAVDREEIGALTALVEGRSPSACVVAGLRTLDLDHIGTQIAEDHRRERSRKNA